MIPELIVKTKSLGGTSELTVVAPIRSGLVASLEAATYRTRVQRLLEALDLSRSLSHEYSYQRYFSDAVERVGLIHAVRITVLGEDRLMLSVIFDGGADSYMRVLWQKVGTLLDVIFCNTVDYPLAWNSSFEEWSDWVRRRQIETDYLYATPSSTVTDGRYLRAADAARLACGDAAEGSLAALRTSATSVDTDAWRLLDSPSPELLAEVARQGFVALGLLYRLTSLFLPSDPNGTLRADGAILQRAARDLFREFVRMLDAGDLEDAVRLAGPRVTESLAWLRLRPETIVTPRALAPPLPAQKPVLSNEIQDGIVEPYASVKSGCLLLIGVTDRVSAAEALDRLARQVGWVDGNSSNGLRCNLAVTFSGLRALGVSEERLDLFPLDFKQGMAARSSVLGDVRGNHPQRWTLPSRPASDSSTDVHVELDEVHLVVQLRSDASPVSFGDDLDKNGPCAARVEQIGQLPGLQLLHVQPLVRLFNEKKLIREHFGYVDGSSDPQFGPTPEFAIYPDNQVALGEFVLGYPNGADPVAATDRSVGYDAAQAHAEWLKNGSYLVIRKLAQDVPRFEQAVEQAAAIAIPPLDPELVYAKLMGRWRTKDGQALAARDPGNDFDYADDPEGMQCPLHAHIRRANPRAVSGPADWPLQPGARPPRLLRRSLSYGELYKKDEPAGRHRGLMFMAYMSSIAEQFEVVQRWISGGNSTAGFSGRADPILGVPSAAGRRLFAFEDNQNEVRVLLDGTANRPAIGPLPLPQPFVELEWGLYAFAPSRSALAELARNARLPVAFERPWSVRRGRDLIDAIGDGCDAVAVEAWKAALEDADAQRTFTAASIWAAIRQCHQGVLRTPYGVIVASRDRIDQVLTDRERRYSVSGYQDALRGSIGPIYLGEDDTGPGCPYAREAPPINAAIASISERDAFEAALKATRETIDRLIENQKAMPPIVPGQWELDVEAKEIIEPVLGILCQEWFGLPESSPTIERGGARWDWKVGDKALYPGNFTAPSRHLFQPRPSVSVQQFGEQYGLALRRQFGALIQQHLDAIAAGKAPLIREAPLARAIFDAGHGQAADVLARAMVGVMMGFLPTTDGNLRLSLNEWLLDGSFWTLRTRLLDQMRSKSAWQARELLSERLVDSMLLRPVPELVWRTATTHHRLGDECILPGDRIVVAIVSATHEAFEKSDRRREDLAPIFGGKRQHGGPVHACPAWEAAFGTMLGVLTALLGRPETLRPGPAPLTWRFSGSLPQPEGASETPGTPIASATPGGAVEPVAPAGGVQTVVAPPCSLIIDGDSWFSYWLGNLTTELQAQNFVLDTLARPQTELRLFSGGDASPPLAPRLDQLCARIRDAIVRGRPLDAIALSLGGNDAVRGTLTRLLMPYSASHSAQLNDNAVAAIVDGRMRAWLTRVLTAVAAAARRRDGSTVPIFIHGYDYPVPDGRPAVDFQGASLAPYLEQVGYSGLPDRIEIMRLLIVRLNQMQIAVCSDLSLGVSHVDLQGTLSNDPATYMNDWRNELHPSPDGFARLADKFGTEIRRVLAVRSAAGIAASVVS